MDVITLSWPDHDASRLYSTESDMQIYRMEDILVPSLDIYTYTFGCRVANFNDVLRRDHARLLLCATAIANA